MVCIHKVNQENIFKSFPEQDFQEKISKIFPCNIVSKLPIEIIIIVNHSKPPSKSGKYPQNILRSRFS